MSQPKELKGVGGWLAFLIVGLCVLGPAIGTYQGFQNFGAAESSSASIPSLATWEAYKQAAWCLFAVTSALRIAAGLALLLSRHWSAARFAIAALWLCPLLSAAVDYFLVSHYFGRAGDSEAVLPLLQLAKGWFWAIVWSAYLIKSVRVRNTYVVRPNNSFKPKPLRGSA